MRIRHAIQIEWDMNIGHVWGFRHAARNRGCWFAEVIGHA